MLPHVSGVAGYIPAFPKCTDACLLPIVQHSFHLHVVTQWVVLAVEHQDGCTAWVFHEVVDYSFVMAADVTAQEPENYHPFENWLKEGRGGHL